MNALEAASLVMIPSGYENGTLGSLKPTDGTGDFTFSRGSDISATRVNEDGYIEKGYENLLLQSNSFDTTWISSGITITSGQAGYDGTNDAWLLDKNNAGASEFIRVDNSVSGVSTASFYSKSNTLDWLFILVFDGAVQRRAWFNVSTGTLGTLSNVIDASIESAGNGYYRCSVSVSGCTQLRIYAGVTDGVATGSLGSIYIQDAMLNQGLVAYPYVETTTAPVAGGILVVMPRLDYSNGSCPSLLLEPERTNIIRYSEYFDAWVKTGASVTNNTTISPDGKTNASTITGSGSYDRIYQNVDYTAGDYTFSVFVKKTDTSQTFAASFGPTNVDEFSVNLNTGVKIYQGVNISNVYSISYGDWWRVIATSTRANGTRIQARIFAGYPTNISPIIYGAQVEKGSYPTSYIPTYGTSQTRLADDVSNLAGLDSLNSAATIVAEFKVDSTGSGYLLQSTGGGSYVNISHYTQERLRMIVRFEGVTQILAVLSYILYPNTDYKLALRYDTNKADVFLNGENIISRTGTWTLEPLDTLLWGFNEGNETKQLLVFPTALSDDECIELTTI